MNGHCAKDGRCTMASQCSALVGPFLPKAYKKSGQSVSDPWFIIVSVTRVMAVAASVAASNVVFHAVACVMGLRATT